MAQITFRVTDFAPRRHSRQTARSGSAPYHFRSRQARPSHTDAQERDPPIRTRGSASLRVATSCDPHEDGEWQGETGIRKGTPIAGNRLLNASRKDDGIGSYCRGARHAVTRSFTTSTPSSFLASFSQVNMTDSSSVTYVSWMTRSRNPGLAVARSGVCKAAIT